MLEARFAEIKKTQPELLAHHYTEAGLIEQAIPYWQQAWEQTTRRSAHAEVIAHIGCGLELLQTLPDTPARARHELLFQTTLGPALVAIRSYAAPEVGTAASDVAGPGGWSHSRLQRGGFGRGYHPGRVTPVSLSLAESHGKKLMKQ